MPQEPAHERRRESTWHSIVVPTAVGMEGFFWRLAWFGLLVALCFGGCLQQVVIQRSRNYSGAAEQQTADAPLPEAARPDE